MELNLLKGYPEPKSIRKVSKNLRTIKQRIVASRRDFDFFDGDRNYGYGGFTYDGRWKPIAERIINNYFKNNSGNFLQLNCEKGFLLHDIKELNENINVYGLETSKYAISKSMTSIKENIVFREDLNLPFKDSFFDFVVAIGSVYTRPLNEAIFLLKELQRVSNGKCFITLATYSNEDEYFLFKDWTLLGCLMFKREEWLEVLKEANYQGFYYFHDSKSLKLVRV